MRSNNKRHDILEAALAVVADKGAGHLTIDAVAARSGFSKGGVLYHFASKDALLTGMLSFLIEANESRLSAGGPNSNQLAAFLSVENRMSEKEHRASLALLAAASQNPDLLTPAKDYMQSLIARLCDEADDPVKVITLFLANEGMRFLDILDINPLTKDQVNAVTRRLGDRASKA